MKKFLVLALLAPIGCSPEQERAWWEWFERSPRAAVTWAVEECGDLCSDDWDRDGVVEPDAGWSDVTATPEDTDVGWGQCAEWMGDALAAGWTVEQWATLNWVMYEESRCDPGATSSAGAQGLLQVMGFWADDCGGGDLYEPWFNLACGLHVYNVQGWGAWDVVD